MLENHNQQLISQLWIVQNRRVQQNHTGQNESMAVDVADIDVQIVRQLQINVRKRIAGQVQSDRVPIHLSDVMVDDDRLDVELSKSKKWSRRDGK